LAKAIEHRIAAIPKGAAVDEQGHCPFLIGEGEGFCFHIATAVQAQVKAQESALAG